MRSGTIGRYGTRWSGGFGRVGVWALIIIGAVVIVLAMRRSGAPDAVAWQHDVPTAMASAQADDKPVLLYFTADWCGPCQMMKRDTFPDPQVKETLETRFLPVKLDISSGSSPHQREAQQYGVRAIPSFIVLAPDGRVMQRMEGYLGPDDCLAWLRGALPAG